MKDLLSAKGERAKKKGMSASIQTRLDDNRVAELLDVAAAVFIEHGFEGASTNEIARRGNCSKTTLYARYPNKEKLFLAVLERRMELILNDFATTLQPDLPMEHTLKEYSFRLLQLVLSENQRGMVRVIGMESSRFPDLGKRFYELGPGRGVTVLAKYMEEQIKRQRLVKSDPQIMAEHLMSLITGGYVRWTMLGVPDNFSMKEKRQRIDAAVEMFLRAYSTSSGHALKGS
ncbi:TetR/AcrR family transcriptional regulator [Edaphobacter albus]|uniref:TetR/AcrR family transcriptional regulator n=1 Tax=Edaphobacter sp. 4G125 TaxID=2763071 RepID=UPI0016489F24|nr:TetR/AcrR family transcriptional regulator [Edaphobacter sp. 4G125]QNI37984.1 TetR/AcrR family transcriptional regulator [Edaphobacter sp. 4G125]